jgi:microsomal epoxide hydrolase
MPAGPELGRGFAMLLPDSLASGTRGESAVIVRRLLLGAALGLGLGAAVGAPTASAASAAPAQPAGFVETAPGVRIRVIDAGPKDAPLTLVLVPGWRFAADIWAGQIVAFAGKYRVIALDPRSQGASTKAIDGNTPEDLHAILAHLHAGPAVLVGWSQGAQDVGAYAAKFAGEDLRGLVFVDGAPSQGWEKAAAAPGAAQQLRQVSLYARYPREATEGMMQAVFKTPRPKAQFDALMATALKTPPAIGAAMLEDDLFGPDRMSPLAKVSVPALLIVADASPNAADLAALGKVLPKARSVTVAGAGHAVFVDQPQKFDALLQAFLAGL